ncbi:hypothetical protein E2C01_037112 [Portunus trituberculatus]|uniref:Uncharacterized protein n=1 Tax=Portunus trituberculatus TaxID=210409 RepID=A0A5B7FG75_PORTR|nr:hypothetical protein [Portunus trituberculatus]
MKKVRYQILYQWKEKKGDRIGVEAGKAGPTLTGDNRRFTKFWPCEAASVKLTFPIRERLAGIPDVSPAEERPCWCPRMCLVSTPPVPQSLSPPVFLCLSFPCLANQSASSPLSLFPHHKPNNKLLEIASSCSEVAAGLNHSTSSSLFAGFCFVVCLYPACVSCLYVCWDSEPSGEPCPVTHSTRAIINLSWPACLSFLLWCDVSDLRKDGSTFVFLPVWVTSKRLQISQRCGRSEGCGKVDDKATTTTTTTTTTTATTTTHSVNHSRVRFSTLLFSLGSW